MQAFLVSLGAVALAELGDKTQLLSLVLAARFRKPWPITLGIVAAAAVSQAIAAGVGGWLAHWLTPEVQRWLIGISFLVMAAWALLPEKEIPTGASPRGGHGVFAVTFAAFFVAELGDRTQIATVVLGARYHPLWQVVAGGTVGLIIANVPVVWMGTRFAGRLPLRLVRLCSAALFAALGLWVLLR